MTSQYVKREEYAKKRRWYSPRERIFNLVDLNPCLHFTGAGAFISTSLLSSTSDDPESAALLVLERVTRPGP
jgi:hypothetical protein